MDRNGH